MSPTTQPPRPDDGLADFLPDALLTTDAAGVVRAANAATSALVGHARRYLIGKPVATVFHPAAFAVLRARMAQAADGDRVLAFETRLRSLRTGGPRAARVWLAPMRAADGALVGLRWLVRDVTEQVATAARLARLEAAHAQELRTRTMELEATCRLLQARLAAHEDGAVAASPSLVRMTPVPHTLEVPS